MAIIEFCDVTMTYGRGRKKAAALRGVSFGVDEGAFAVLMGPSGAGKSTLLKLVLAMERPDHGSIRVAGRDIQRLRKGSIPYLRRNVGAVFQDFKLLPDVFFYVKDLESRFRYLNRLTWEGLGAKSEAEALGKSDVDFHPPAMATAYVAEDRQVMRDGAVLNRIWLVHNLGLRLPQWVVSSKVPLFNPRGNVVGLAGVMYLLESPQLRAHYFQELEPAVRYLEQRANEVVDMAEVARQVPCSRTQLNRRFRILLHVTPTEYLMAIRIQTARRLLAHSDLDVAQIAVDVGFCDQSHFTRRFRLVTGETPAAFRRAYRKR